MAATNRKSTTGSSTKPKEQPKKITTQGKLKPKRKQVSRSTARPLVAGLLVLSLGLVIAYHYVSLAEFLSKELKSLGIISSKEPFRFKPQPIPEFDISRGIDRRSNLSLEEFIELYDAKW